MNAVRLFVFLGAFLLFTMEPMVGRMLLPHFGGAFHVWTTSLMFFQGVLFFAYSYAHLGAERVGKWHFAIVAIPLIALPPTVVVAGSDVPALLMEDYIWHHWKQGKFEATHDEILKKTNARVNKRLEKTSGKSDSLSEDALLQWLDTQGQGPQRAGKNR